MTAGATSAPEPGQRPSAPTRDLVVLVADLDAEQALAGLLARPDSLGCRRFTVDIHRHPMRDSGVFREAHDFLRPFARSHAHALVVFDWEGSGAEQRQPADAEADVEARLETNGWGPRAAAVAIGPELESWVWSDSPHVPDALRWSGDGASLRDWLRERACAVDGTGKPQRPKEAMDAVRRHTRTPRSASLFRQLASRVSLRRCTDPAFTRLTRVLQGWFPRRSDGAIPEP